MRYRNIEYTVEKRSIYWRPHQLSWSGRILFPGKSKDISSLGCKTRVQLVSVIKHEIDEHQLKHELHQRKLRAAVEALAAPLRGDGMRYCRNHSLYGEMPKRFR